jgi:hypothetical protein
VPLPAPDFLFLPLKVSVSYKKGEVKSGRGEEKRKWGRGRKTETNTAGWVEGSVGGRKSGREGRRAR